MAYRSQTSTGLSVHVYIGLHKVLYIAGNFFASKNQLRNVPLNPGSPRNTLAMRDIIQRACKEAEGYKDSGVVCTSSIGLCFILQNSHFANLIPLKICVNKILFCVEFVFSPMKLVCTKYCVFIANIKNLNNHVTVGF